MYIRGNALAISEQDSLASKNTKHSTEILWKKKVKAKYSKDA